jgi:hypothetical protein
LIRHGLSPVGFVSTIVLHFSLTVDRISRSLSISFLAR